MNEKTKRILSYVACGLGGVALGIALLSGLSYCSVNEKAEQTEVNTILSKPKGEQINTGSTGGNYTGYRFTIEPQWSTYTAHLGNGYARIYDVDTSNYTLTLATTESYTGINSAQTNYNNVKALVSSSRSNEDTLRFIFYQAYSIAWSGAQGYYAFLSFLTPTTGNTRPTAFLLTSDWVNARALNYQTSGWMTTAYDRGTLIVNTSISDVLLFDSNGQSLPSSFVFQDVASYYKTIGYGDGYEQGDTDGYNTGYWAGYNDGVGTAGNFTDISGNVNAVIDLSELGVSTTTSWYSHGLSDSKYYTLLQFRDQDEESWTVYIEDGVESDQPNGTRTTYINLYSHSQQVYKGWLGYAVRDSSSNTFSVQKINEYSFEFATVTNVLGRSLTQEYVLIWGWVSDNVSYQAGYNAGYADGFDGTNVNNVFSLFTGAFNAVGGIFNLKVFGFLPLYWFFLTPIFIAIIALLLRMIKH